MIDLTDMNVEPTELERLCEESGLSEHMLRILIDEFPPGGTRRKQQDLQRCLATRYNNAKIRSMGAEAVEKARLEMQLNGGSSSKKKKTTKKNDEKVYSDDEVRKYILERREQQLKQTEQAVYGSDREYEKMSPLERDFRMIHEFVGFAQTSHDAYIFVYYVGPREKGRHDSELKRADNWMPVPRAHLCFFHRDLSGHIASCLRHSSLDQRELADNSRQPAYDPRFIVHKWLDTAKGKQMKQEILTRRHLLLDSKDFIVEQHRKKDENATFPYYHDPNFKEKKKKRSRTERNEGEEQRRQARHGFEVMDERFRTVGHEEYEALAGYPLPAQDSFQLHEMTDLTRRSYFNEQIRQRDDFYTWQPITLVKAAAIAFNPEAYAKRAVSHLCNEQLKMIERDQMQPLLDHLGQDAEMQQGVKDATAQYLYSCFTLQFLAQSLPVEIEKTLESRDQKALVMLDT